MKIKTIGKKKIYNMDNKVIPTSWIGNTKKRIEFPKLSSALKVKDTKFGYEMGENCFSTLVSNSNNVYKNAQSVYIINGGFTENVGNITVSKENIDKVMALFTARVSIKGNWINDKDEYCAPNQDII